MVRAQRGKVAKNPQKIERKSLKLFRGKAKGRRIKNKDGYT